MFGPQPNLLLYLLALSLSPAALAEDWPTFRHDFGRTGSTLESLQPPLAHLWRHRSAHAPRAAWPAPARRDIWNQHEGLQPEITFDRAYHTSVVEGLLYYASSADDHVVCLDLADGALRWTFITDGPVRLSPTVVAGRVYVGSDDGCVYCLDAASGGLLWRRQVAPQTRFIPGNGRMISAWPVRCGIVVEEGTIYCCAGLFPGEGVYVAALEAETGAVRWCENCDSISPQGHLVASASRLFVPTGRTAPVPFGRADGKQLGGYYGGGGGTFALVTEETLISGPGRMEPTVDFRDVSGAQSLAAFRGLHLVVAGGMSYLHSGKSISALDRREWVRLARERNELQKTKAGVAERLKTAKESGATEEAQKAQAEVEDLNERIGDIVERQEACTLWNVPSQEPYAMILAGETLFCGGDGLVVAHSAGDGGSLWSAEVEGRAYGLCAANGMLIVSTDKGVIDCFGPKEGQK